MSKFASFMSAVGTIANVALRAAEANQQKHNVPASAPAIGNTVGMIVSPVLTGSVTYCGNEWVFTKSKMVEAATRIGRDARAAGVSRAQIEMFTNGIKVFSNKMFFDNHDVVIEQYMLYTGQTMYRLICDNQMVSLTF